MVTDTTSSLDGAYQLFFGLLAPTEHGGVVIPRHFARPFKNGVCKSIWESKTSEPLVRIEGSRYATGLTEQPLRGALDVLLEDVLDVIEEDPSDYFTARDQGLQLHEVSEAKLAHDHARLIYGKDYAQLYDSFPAAFAYFALPFDSKRIMMEMGRMKQDPSLFPPNQRRFGSVL